MSCAIRARSRSRACSATNCCSRSSRSARSQPARTSSCDCRQNRPTIQGPIPAQTTRDRNDVPGTIHAGTSNAAGTATATTTASTTTAGRTRSIRRPARNAAPIAGTAHQMLTVLSPIATTAPTSSPPSNHPHHRCPLRTGTTLRSPGAAPNLPKVIRPG
ncbi:hypothetical protein OG535_23550 [Kitasatospora sp. NBC_00085]|uniref:hypothetical protein n=1 Tax=unclassified Kitasatospora TaxID=2633591 RepID=UPI00324368BC